MSGMAKNLQFCCNYCVRRLYSPMPNGVLRFLAQKCPSSPSNRMNRAPIHSRSSSSPVSQGVRIAIALGLAVIGQNILSSVANASCGDYVKYGNHDGHTMSASHVSPMDGDDFPAGVIVSRCSGPNCSRQPFVPTPPVKYTFQRQVTKDIYFRFSAQVLGAGFPALLLHDDRIFMSSEDYMRVFRPPRSLT